MAEIISLFSSVFFVGYRIVQVAILVAGGWYIGMKYLDYRKKRWMPWQMLAEQNNLIFHSAGLFTNPKVRGIYKGYDCVLQICRRNYGNGRGNYTQIGLSKHGPQATRPNLAGDLLSADDVVNLLKPSQLDIGLWERVMARSFGQEISYEKPGLELNLDQLQYLFDWLYKIAANYLAIVSSGDVAIPILENFVRRNSRLKPISTQLLRDIAQETTNRLREQASRLRCINCLTSCEAYQIKLDWPETITYYGCRTCGQSREFYSQPTAIVVLNNQTDTELKLSSKILEVNWVVEQKLFDFDVVEIVEATDEEVERFAVQIGNDMDIVRASKYTHMRCNLHPGCHLSENTLRILNRTFGRVEIKEKARSGQVCKT